MHDPTEHVQEHVQHTAAHGDHDEHGHGGHGLRRITAAALTAAILAAFAAISGALSNGHLTESTHKRIDANDQWSYYQSKSIKSSIIDSRIYAASIAHQPPSKKDVAKRAEYEEQLPEIQKMADALVKISTQHVEVHETYEMAETMFHISIAIVAIAVVAKRRSFWYVSMIAGTVGLFDLHGPILTPSTPSPPSRYCKRPPPIPAAASAPAPVEHECRPLPNQRTEDSGAFALFAFPLRLVGPAITRRPHRRFNFQIPHVRASPHLVGKPPGLPCLHHVSIDTQLFRTSPAYSGANATNEPPHIPRYLQRLRPYY